MNTEPVETLDLWAWQFVVFADLYNDQLVRDMVLRMQAESAAAAAEKDGYVLVGEPEIAEEPAVWLPEFADGRGGLVGLDFARRGGYDGEPTAYLYRYQWPARKKPPRRMQCEDIDDQHVIDLAARFHTAHDRSAELASGPLMIDLSHQCEHDKGVIELLVEEGVPEELAYAKVEHLSDRDYLDYGGSPRYAWPTGKRLPEEKAGG